jgi:diaminopimelate epimerase
LARRIADRHFGVGGDGLILIRPTDVADARMQMFNADGSEAEMCGNGIRCVAKYVYDHGVARKNPLAIETRAGVLKLEVEIADEKVYRVRVDMGEPILDPPLIPATFVGSAEHKGAIVNARWEVDGRALRSTCVSMGNPHCITFVDKLTDDWVLGIGPKIEVDSHFPQRVNAEFVEVVSRDEVRQRTWERGSGETLACGTGACAVCVAGVLSGRTDRRLLVHLPGGDLELDWDETTNHVFMTGPAMEVFSGEWSDD